MGVTRIWMERFGAWVIVGISLVVTVLVLASGEWSAISGAGAGGWPTLGPALDLVIAMPVSWLPLVADYNRFATGPRAAFRGTCVGYLIANVWLYSLGALLVLSASAQPSPAGIAAGILAVAGGSIAGMLFLVGLLAGEADEAFADIYSGAMSLKNVWPNVPRAALVIGIGVIAALLARWLTMERYESFLFLIGSVFVPLFGVFIAYYFFRSGVRTNVSRAAAFGAWILGSLTYHWIAPTGPAGWVEAVSGILGTPLSVRWEWLNASVPSFAVAFVVALGAQRISSAGPRQRGDHEDRGEVQHM